MILKQADILSQELKQRIQKVRVFIVDIDGVLTDGRLIFGNYGDELKFFDVQDGLGMVLLKSSGMKTVMLTSRKSKINQKRAKELGVDKLYQEAGDKLKVYEKILKRFKVAADQTCYVGDDLIDLPVLSRVGFAAAVDNAVPEVKQRSHYVSSRAGGRGAVREIADLVLKAQDKWESATERYKS